MRYAAAPVGLVLVGVAVALLAGGTTAGVAVAMALIGSAAVIAVALAFLAVGRAEDRDRAAGPPPATQDAAGAPEPAAAPKPATEPEPPAARAAEHPRTLGLGPERRYRRPPRRPG